jgi:hypothetical protein
MHSGATAGLAVLVAVGYLSWHCPVPCQAAELRKCIYAKIYSCKMMLNMAQRISLSGKYEAGQWVASADT